MANTKTSTMGSSDRGLWSTIKRAAKEHHQSVNAAYSTFYGTGTADIASRSSSRATSAATTPAASNFAPNVASPRASADHSSSKCSHAVHPESLSTSVWGLYGASNAR